MQHTIMIHTVSFKHDWSPKTAPQLSEALDIEIKLTTDDEIKHYFTYFLGLFIQRRLAHADVYFCCHDNKNNQNELKVKSGLIYS